MTVTKCLPLLGTTEYKAYLHARFVERYCLAHYLQGCCQVFLTSARQLCGVSRVGVGWLVNNPEQPQSLCCFTLVVCLNGMFLFTAFFLKRKFCFNFYFFFTFPAPHVSPEEFFCLYNRYTRAPQTRKNNPPPCFFISVF